MRLKDLSGDQKLQLKQDILTRRMDENGESPSYGELADADDLVSDKELEDEFGGTEFVPEDGKVVIAVKVINEVLGGGLWRPSELRFFKSDKSAKEKK